MKKVALGLGLVLLFVAFGFGAAHAQVYSNPTGTTNGTTNMSSTVGASSSVPGVPNTGAGGDAGTNIMLLATSAIIMALGIVYITRKSMQTVRK